MGEKSIATGLWGRDDYEQMLKAMRTLKKFVQVEMTADEGGTRRPGPDIGNVSSTQRMCLFRIIQCHLRNLVFQTLWFRGY